MLLDEPLSALDLKLRKAMQIELKQIQRETGITFIFVTHDQEEALTMSDRIAVMSAGELQQFGDPREIYERPQNRFVADFIGETNLFEVTVGTLQNGRAQCQIAGGHVIECDAPEGVSGSAHLSVRPERMVLSKENTSGTGIPARVLENIFVGTDITTLLKADGGPEFSVRTSNSARSTIFDPGTAVFVTIEAGSARLLSD